MAYEQKDLTGSLFKNERKTTDQHPGMTGSALIDGVAYFVDSWKNVDSKGQPYLSMKFKRKEKQPEQQPSQQAAPVSRQTAGRVPFDDMDSDIPPF